MRISYIASSATSFFPFGCLPNVAFFFLCLRRQCSAFLVAFDKAENKVTRGRNIVADGWALGRDVSAVLIKPDIIASNAKLPYCRAYCRGRLTGVHTPPHKHTNMMHNLNRGIAFPYLPTRVWCFSRQTDRQTEFDQYVLTRPDDNLRTSALSSSALGLMGKQTPHL